jgi:hypothetical protein
MKAVKAAIAAAAVGGIILTGVFASVITDKEDGRFAPRVKPSPSPSTQTYYKATAVAADLIRKGIECDTFEPVAVPLNGSLDMGACQDGNLVISIFGSSQDAQEAPMKLFTLLGGAATVTMIVGPNWTVNCDVPNCEAVADALYADTVRLSLEK